mgnify:FL=1
MGQKDITQKNFEAYNDVFSDIVNGTLFDGREVIKPEALVDAMAKSQYKADDNVIHEQERDVAKYWTDKNCYIRLALLGVENQLAIDVDMPLRVIGYDGSSYRDEMNQDEIVIDERTGKKHKIRHERYPVVTIVLYFGKTPWKKPLSLYDVLKISDNLKPFVNDYKINLIDVPRLTGEQVEKFTSDFQIIADYFVQLNESNDYVPKEKTIKHADSFLKLMSVLTQDDKYVEMSKEISHGKEGFNMCEVLDRAEARGEARGQAIGEARGKAIGEAMGEARGKAIGEARGKTIGALNKTVEILRVIIAKNSWSKEQAMEFIGIPKSEFAKYAALL